MTRSGEPSPAESDAVLNSLAESLDRPAREANKALVRWLLDAELPLFATCVLFTLEPPRSPVGVREVADMLGISIEDASRALRELRGLGYVQEDKRRYEPTEEGLRVHASLASARREALAAFLASVGDDELRELAEVSSKPRSR
jgi:DNA-binding MarR family transcriptional regulator